MADLCDVVHARWVQRLEAEVRLVQQAALTAGVEPPGLDDALDEFEAALVAPPNRVDPDELDLRRALGLRVAG